MRKRRKHRKAPEAPKKALTPYIIFSKKVRPEVKASLPEGTKVTEVVRRIAEKWSAMSEEEKSPFIKLAQEDKFRYNQEISTYEGPLHIPINRRKSKANKDPDQPKRAMSAFLFFSNDKRKELQEQNPDMRIPDISARLGEMWRKLSEEEKKPYEEQSKQDRDRYQQEQTVYKGKAHIEANKNISIKASTTITSQWATSAVDSGMNPMYGAVYEMPSSQPSFANISIPMNFTNIVQ